MHFFSSLPNFFILSHFFEASAGERRVAASGQHNPAAASLGSDFTFRALYTSFFCIPLPLFAKSSSQELIFTPRGKKRFPSPELAPRKASSKYCRPRLISFEKLLLIQEAPLESISIASLASQSLSPGKSFRSWGVSWRRRRLALNCSFPPGI